MKFKLNKKKMKNLSITTNSIDIKETKKIAGGTSFPPIILPPVTDVGKCAEITFNTQCCGMTK